MYQSRTAILSVLIAALPLLSIPAFAQQKKKKTPPTRAFDGPGAPTFTRLDDQPGKNPPLDACGNFLIGPQYFSAPERQLADGVPKGRIHQFKIDSRQTRLFNPGIARKELGTVDPNNPRTLIVETHPVDYERQITVYIPRQYEQGTESP
ncbi:MAG: esterase family protein, partial [Planctomycetota bacterium]